MFSPSLSLFLSHTQTDKSDMHAHTHTLRQTDVQTHTSNTYAYTSQTIMVEHYSSNEVYKTTGINIERLVQGH